MRVPCGKALPPQRLTTPTQRGRGHQTASCHRVRHMLSFMNYWISAYCPQQLLSIYENVYLFMCLCKRGFAWDVFIVGYLFAYIYFLCRVTASPHPGGGFNYNIQFMACIVWLKQWRSRLRPQLFKPDSSRVLKYSSLYWNLWTFFF